ncbi:DeoR/GlpR family DNA-binding transcription regulator [Niveibacterium sp. SC-1]|uniref:DeoR/GlpR family DNA-binding transcription regulator n=1 Tax=Niveibacterium sp. SC-1 TaxID=3135646 RepID=UPI00311EE6D4
MTTNNDALPGERQQKILALLGEHGRVLATDLAARFGVSEDSVRRDLRELAARGMCRRVYGGALSLVLDFAPLAQRQERQVDIKQLLARRAVQLVRPRQVLMIDAGSTNSAVADALPENLDLTVFTNAPDIAQRLIEKNGFEIYLIGGRIDRRVGEAVGAQTVDEIRRLRADLCFPGACAIDVESGLWSMASEEALIKRTMIECSGESVIVVSKEKLGTTAVTHVAPVGEIDHLVVEQDADAELCKAFEQHGVAVHRAEPQ